MVRCERFAESKTPARGGGADVVWGEYLESVSVENVFCFLRVCDCISSISAVFDTNALSRDRHRTSMTIVVCLRHGETDWNANRRLQGWAPTPLNERGREQAESAGEHLASTYEFDRVVASDLRRTRETAALVCDSLELDPTYEKAWRERDFGVYQGLTYETMFSEYPEFDVGQSGKAALDVVPEGGESLLDLAERVLDGFERLLAEATGETVLVVAHGGPLYAVLSHVKDLDYATAINEGSQDNCAVNELRYEGDGFEVVRESDTSYRE